MIDAKELKRQRDRFLAFSFASADLFMEVTREGIVDYALGAAKSLTGIDHESLVGKHWLDIFAEKDRQAIEAMQSRAREGLRCGPLSVSTDARLGGGQKAIVTSIKMPGNARFHVTVGFTSVVMQRLAQDLKGQASYELLDKDDFLEAAREAFTMARTLGQDAEMTLLDIAGVRDAKGRMGDETWNQFIGSVTSLLGARSIDGHAVAEISEGRYSVVHNRSVTSATLQSELMALIPQGETLDVQGKTVAADLQSLSERETMKALVYTINEFERKGSALDIDTLNSGFKTYVNVNAHKIQQFKKMVEQLSFDFDYQPIVSLDTHELSHFEMLSRFRAEGSTREWVIFAEDIGMAADFDIAVCERAINYLLYKSAGHRTKFAVNLSGQSIQNEQFFKTLLAKLTMNRELANRLVFEIIESSTITELEKVNRFIETLKKNGFKVCLDDFGAGSSAPLQYVQSLHVDYIKIDGQYTQKVLHSERDSVLIRSVAQMCNDLGIVVIAERIEHKEQAERLRALGVALGQGYYFAHPANKPSYDPTKIPVA